MKNTNKNKSVIDEYLKDIDTSQRNDLERIRQIVKKIVPEAVEVISYGMPGFKYKGKHLVGFAAFKDHLSLFPTGGPIEDLKEKLKEFKTSTGTIQFTVEKPLSELIIEALVLNRVNRIKGNH